MGTSKEVINAWIQAAPPKTRWMLVVLDTFDGECYPSYFDNNPKSVLDRIIHLKEESADRLIECYDLTLNIAEQLGEPIAMHTPQSGMKNPMPKPIPFNIGDIVRYGGEGTDLMRIYKVMNLNCDDSHVYGRHCMGGSACSNVSQCSRPSDTDMATWHLHNPTADDLPVKPPAIIPPDITATLTERGNRYGVFAEHAQISQGIKYVMAESKNWHKLASDQKECLEMIAHKIGRILNGDPNYHDSWHDIQGYTKLVADRLAR